MARTRSLRQLLILDLALIVALLVATIMAATWWANRRAVASLSNTIISQLAARLDSELHRFFDPVKADLLVAHTWIEEGTLDPADVRALRRFLETVLETTPQIAAARVALANGASIVMQRDARGELSIASSPPPGDGEATRATWEEAALQRRAESSHEPVWSFPPLGDRSPEPVVVAATASRVADTTLVLAFDVPVEDISEFTMRQDVSREGRMAVLTSDGRFVGLPADPRFEDVAVRRAALLRPPQEIGIPLIQDAREAFLERGPSSEAVSFRSSGRSWWAQIRPFQLGPRQTLGIAVVVPDSEVFPERHRIDVAIILAAAAILGAAAVRTISLARRISRPVEALAHQSDRIREGDLDSPADVPSGFEEVERLAAAHERMRTGLRSLIRLEGEMQVASQIQRRTFPESLPEVKGYDIAAWSEPAQETGGDTYDVISLDQLEEVDDPRVLFLLADASGHGIGPALTVTQTRSMLRMALRLHGDLRAIVHHLNEQLVADLPVNRFITAWLGVLDPGRSTLHSFSAAQGPLLLYRADRGEVESIDTDTVPLGLVRHLVVAPRDPIELRPGDVLLVASDGIFEAFDPDGRELGIERTAELLARRHADSAAQIVAALRSEVENWTQGAPAEDDRTVVVVAKRA